MPVPVRVEIARIRGVHVRRAIVIFHCSEEGYRPGDQSFEVGDCRTRRSLWGTGGAVLEFGGLTDEWCKGGRWLFDVSWLECAREVTNCV